MRRTFVAILGSTIVLSSAGCVPQEKYDNLVAEMPMRVRARIFKPVLRGREKALKEKIDLSGVRQKLRRVGRKSFLVRPPPPPPKDDA